MKLSRVSLCAKQLHGKRTSRTFAPAQTRCIVAAGMFASAVACEGRLLTLGQQPLTTSDPEPDTTVDAADETPSSVATVDTATNTPDPGDASREPPALMDAGEDTPSVDTQDTSSDPVDAGANPSEPPAFRAPRVIAPRVVPVIGSDDKDDNPTLTSDLLEIYFTSTRSGNSDVWFARRDSVDVDFDPPEPLTVVNTSEFESSPAVDGDGLTLWIARRTDEGMGGVDIYASRRASRADAWGEAELVANLSTTGDDIPRPPGAGGLIMPLSIRTEGDTYQLYLATRQDTTSEFSPAVPLQGLRREGYGSVDGFISWNGEHLLFAYTRDDTGDLYIAPHSDTGFANAVPLLDVNTEADERDPWLSPDGKILFFASNRDETLRIYSAELEWD